MYLFKLRRNPNWQSNDSARINTLEDIRNLLHRLSHDSIEEVRPGLFLLTATRVNGRIDRTLYRCKE